MLLFARDAGFPRPFLLDIESITVTMHPMSGSRHPVRRSEAQEPAGPAPLEAPPSSALRRLSNDQRVALAAQLQHSQAPSEPPIQRLADPNEDEDFVAPQGYENLSEERQARVRGLIQNAHRRKRRHQARAASRGAERRERRAAGAHKLRYRSAARHAALKAKLAERRRRRKRVMQRKADGASSATSASSTSRSSSASTPMADVPVARAGTGRPLPPPLRRNMEQSLGHDLSRVRVHEGAEAAQVDALAYTRGDHIHFRRGLYDPHSLEGRKMLGHELAHVVQQREGRVSKPDGPDAPINEDAGLEREADQLGDRASRSLFFSGRARRSSSHSR